jgi:hypothetical protein
MSIADTVKTIGIALLTGAIGFGSKQVIESYGQNHVVEEHTQQIGKLFDIAKKTQDGLQEQAVTTARIEGKIDVINQKIDDDRTIKHGSR